MTNEIDYNADMDLDPEALDVESARQPNLVMKYGIMLADAEQKESRLKEKVDIVGSEISEKIRTNPSSYGMEKATEGSIHEKVIKEKKYLQATSELRVISNKVSKLKVAMRALDHKKKSIENFVSLTISQYCAGPKTPRDLKKIFARGDDVNSKIKERALQKSREESEE